MFAFYIIIFIIYIMTLNFFLNEEILLFITFSLFFFIVVQNMSFIIKKTINLSRYKIYNKFLKSTLMLMEILKLNKVIFKLNNFYVILRLTYLIKGTKLNKWWEKKRLLKLKKI